MNLYFSLFLSRPLPCLPFSRFFLIASLSPFPSLRHYLSSTCLLVCYSVSDRMVDWLSVYLFSNHPVRLGVYQPLFLPPCPLHQFSRHPVCSFLPCLVPSRSPTAPLTKDKHTRGQPARRVTALSMKLSHAQLTPRRSSGKLMHACTHGRTDAHTLARQLTLARTFSNMREDLGRQHTQTYTHTQTHT